MLLAAKKPSRGPLPSRSSLSSAPSVAKPELSYPVPWRCRDPPPVAPNLSPSGRVAASAAPGAWRGVGTQSLGTSLPPYPNPFGSQLGEQIGVLRDPTLSDLFGSGISGSKEFI